MFPSIEGQRAVATMRKGGAAAKRETWAKVITPPSGGGYAELSLDSPAGDDEDRAGEEEEVLANVHLAGEVTDITGRYRLERFEGGWVLSFARRGEARRIADPHFDTAGRVR